VAVTDAKILNTSQPPPFPLGEGETGNEEIRLRYRYLDLRRPEDRLTLELALRVLDLATIGKEPSKTGMALFIEP